MVGFSLLLKMHRSKLARYVMAGFRLPLKVHRSPFRGVLFLLPIGHKDKANPARIGGKRAGVPPVELHRRRCNTGLLCE